MAMHKSDYEMVARVIRLRRDPHDRPDAYDEDLISLDVIDSMVYSLADEFGSFDERFNRERFIIACGSQVPQQEASRGT